jgi:hypothetical protein
MGPTSEANRLPASAQRALLAFWEHVASDASDARVREELRVLARLLGDQARTAEMLPERLIVAIKESAQAEARLRVPEVVRARGWVLGELVSHVIREFFGDDVRASRRVSAATPSAIETSAGHTMI